MYRVYGTSTRFEIALLVVRGLVMFIAVSNLWFGFLDNDRITGFHPDEDIYYSLDERVERLKHCGFDLVTISNMLLLGGILLDWYVLIGIWIFIYSFVIFVGSLQFAFHGVIMFHEMPGFPKVLAKSLATLMNLSPDFRPVIGTVTVMLTFTIIVLYLFMCLYVSFRKHEFQAELPTIFRGSAMGQRPTRPNNCNDCHQSTGVSSSCNSTVLATNSTACSTNDGLPTYSEVVEMFPEADGSMNSEKKSLDKTMEKPPQKFLPGHLF